MVDIDKLSHRLTILIPVVSFIHVNILVIFYFNGCAFPSENGQVLPLVEKNCLIDGKLSPKDLGVTLEDSEPKKILNVENNKLFFRVELLYS